MLDMMRVPEGEVFGPMVRVHDRFADVDGLLVPTEFSTYMPGGDSPVGHHLITNFRLESRFDERLAEAPEGAVVDETEDVRAGG